MNTELREAIVKHIFANFGMISSNHVDLDRSKSLLTKDFCLSEKIVFSDGFEGKVFGCQFLMENQDIKVLVSDCTQDQSINEYALLIQIKDLPMYGLYLVDTNFDTNFDNIDSEAMIGVSLDGKDWIQCQTFVQATFLAGMEQIKDMGLNWSKCSDYQSQYKSLLSFIKWHQNIFEDTDEG